ncbi:MAG: hypothetical protein JWM48_1550 [Mycobacterium sp.]|nr:hypothetical protein [Mycobacterium sp.]
MSGRLSRWRAIGAFVVAAVVAVPVSASAAQGPGLVPGVLSGVGGTVTGVLAQLPNVLPGLAHATLLGPAPATQRFSLAVGLQRPDPAGEAAFVAAVENPASPQYRHFLTPQQFADRFGVPAATEQQVERWLRTGGLSVVAVSQSRDLVTATGDAAHVNALFRVTENRYRAGSIDFLANATAPTVPAGLGVKSIVGLNTLQGMRAPHRTAAPAQQTCLALLGCVGLTTPQDLWSVYQQPAAYRGAGQSVGIFGAGRTDDVIADLRDFEKAYGLPQVPVRVVHPAGDTDFTDDSGRLEWNIDTQASSGMAPDLSELVLYFGTDLSDADVLQSLSTWVNDPSGPLQANASFGECETNPTNPVTGLPLFAGALPVGLGLGNNLQPLAEQVLLQARSQGRTLFSSTGDTGSSCPAVILPVIGAGNGILNQAVPLTNYPASSPSATAVGGTVLYTNGAGARSREYAWPFGGGGSTLLISAPDYQRGTPNLAVPCLVDPSGAPTNTGQPCRGVPDVAALAGDALTNGYGIYSAGALTSGGGTSLSSPLWAGMWARVQGAAGTTAGVGFANAAIYPLEKAGGATYARDFFDVSALDVATGAPLGNGLYLPLPGWDYTTGWGTPRVDGLICDIAHKATAAPGCTATG